MEVSQSEQHMSAANMMLIASSCLAIVATFLPWFRLGAVGEARGITPALESYIGPSTLVMVGFLAVGVVTTLVSKSPIILGLGTSVYGTITIVLWLFGSRTSSLLPKRLLPDDFTVRLNFGADVGVIASLLMVVAVFVIAFESTWASPIDLSRIWVIVVAAVVSALLISAREASWAVVDTFDFEWRLTVDSIPVVGDAILALLLLTALFVVAAGVFQKTLLIVASILLSSILLIVGLIGWFARNSIVNIGEWASKRADFLDASSVMIRNSYGPIQLAAVALASISFGVVVLVFRRSDQPYVFDGATGHEISEEDLYDPY